MRRPPLVPVLFALLAAALAWARRRARDVPLSPLSADSYVGADYVERAGIAGPGEHAGEMDDLASYARADFDPDAVHPAVRRFYERTGEYAMTTRVRWHPGFRLGAALASRVTSRVEQLNLPGPHEPATERLRSRIVDVAPEADPREGARAWVRTTDRDGERVAVFVAVYARHRSDGETYTNVAVPLPGGNLSTVLRPEAFPIESGVGIEWTTRTPGDPGLYLVTPLGAFAIPVDQRFRVRLPDDAPAFAAGADLYATHEMWLGRQFLTVEYALERTATSSGGDGSGA